MMINQSNYDETEDSALDEIRNQGLKENNALRVYTYLRANERARSRRLPRWIWELLQNAHDASIAREEPLIVNIKYSPRRTRLFAQWKQFGSKTNIQSYLSWFNKS